MKGLCYKFSSMVARHVREKLQPKLATLCNAVSQCNKVDVARSPGASLTIDLGVEDIVFQWSFACKEPCLVTHFISAARSGSSLLRSLLMKSHSSPANSTPVGPPPTTITLSSLSRSGEDLRRSPGEGLDFYQDSFMHRQVSRWGR